MKRKTLHDEYNIPVSHLPATSLFWKYEELKKQDDKDDLRKVACDAYKTKQMVVYTLFKPLSNSFYS